MRFQKRIKVFPGVRLNLSASGVSTTVGVRGAGVTLGKRGAYANVGIPGTGISHRQKLGKSGSAKASSGGSGGASGGASSGGGGQPLLAPAAPIQSAPPQAATSPGLAGLHETLRAVYAEHDALKAARR